MAAAIENHLPASTRVPSFGGTSFWVRGPDDLDSEELAHLAAAKSVLIEPGRIHFGGQQPRRNYFRLAFSSIDEKRIEPGIRLLAEAIEGCTSVLAETYSQMR